MTIKYVSTRGAMEASEFCEVLLGGLAPDGGLVVPDEYPQVDRATLQSWRGLDYRELAFEVLRLYVTDIDAADLRAIIDRTYTAQVFGSEEITPVLELEAGLHLLRLSNGPTLAFKDVAMQLLGNLFEHVLSREGRELNILGATSGDTGSAAEYALRGKRNVRVFMLSPDARMSAFQRAQMYSLRDENIFNIAVAGVFDECQDLVKAVSNDLAFKSRHAIGTVNSINWARIAAQVVYYFRAYFAVTADNAEQVSFCVPSGNFGNVLAGHIARMMGLPVAQLVVATNENDVLDEFFRTGRYRVRGAGETWTTSSPSMDISKASNFERFVFDVLGRDPDRLASLWLRLERDGSIDLAGSPEFAAIGQFGFASGSSGHADRIASIRRAHKHYGVIVDTHTADGLHVAQSHRVAGVPMICLETAQPVKFAEAIREAIGEEPPRPDIVAGLEERVQRYTRMPADLRLLKRFISERCAVSQSIGLGSRLPA